MDFLFVPWPWYVTGPLIGLLVPLLMLIGSRFGVSGNLETICSIAGAKKLSDYFNFDVKQRIPNLLFVTGAMVGGYLAVHFLNPADFKIDLSENAIASIKSFGITDFSGLQPSEIFNWNFLSSIQGIAALILGGFLVGFGARYAGGCTSGHSIRGLSQLHAKSLIATIGFFVGGLIATHILYPILFLQ